MYTKIVHRRVCIYDSCVETCIYILYYIYIILYIYIIYIYIYYIYIYIYMKVVQNGIHI